MAFAEHGFVPTGELVGEVEKCGYPGCAQNLFQHRFVDSFQLRNPREQWGGKPWAFYDGDTLTPEQQNAAGELAYWWMDLSQKDVEKIVPKAIEYGGGDLDVMAAAMELLIPETVEGLDRRVMAKEMALAFYLLGKVSRLFGAYASGRLPGDDSWYDAEMYTRMGRRVRETGSWIKP